MLPLVISRVVRSGVVEAEVGSVAGAVVVSGSCGFITTIPTILTIKNNDSHNVLMQFCVMT